jgi:uncharacterized RDD family membrane protein YckC
LEESPAWELATFLRRLSAYLLDMVLLNVPLFLFLGGLGALIFVAIQRSDGPGDGGGALLIVMILLALFGLLLLVGYVIWWALALRWGQTPGKQLVGIRVIKDNGEPSDWGHTFLREFVTKMLLGSIFSGITSGIYMLVDNLWLLFDRNRQTLHDKMVSTLVVRNQP